MAQGVESTPIWACSAWGRSGPGTPWSWDRAPVTWPCLDAPLLGSGMLGCYPDAVVEGLYTMEGGQTATGSIRQLVPSARTGAPESPHKPATHRRMCTKCSIQRPLWSTRLRGLDLPGLLAGESRCHAENPLARGVFSGLTLSHGPGHLFPQHLRRNGSWAAAHPR